MTTYQDGYICPTCGPVTAKLWWSNEENDLVASCTECGAKLQRVIPVPFSDRNWVKGYAETFSTPLAGGGKPGHDAESNSLRIPAPAHPQEDT